MGENVFHGNVEWKYDPHLDWIRRFEYVFCKSHILSLVSFIWWVLGFFFLPRPSHISLRKIELWTLIHTEILLQNYIYTHTHTHTHANTHTHTHTQTHTHTHTHTYTFNSKHTIDTTLSYSMYAKYIFTEYKHLKTYLASEKLPRKKPWWSKRLEPQHLCQHFCEFLLL